MSSKKHAGGRPAKYKAEYAEQAAKLCELGATDRDVAAFFKVQERTVYRWQIQYPEFCQALKTGKQSADERVERSLYRRALGYTHDSVHVSNYMGKVTLTPIVEHHPPDTTAAIFWIKNRKPAEWRDVKAVEHSGSVQHRHTKELSEAELEHIAAGGSARAAEPTQGAQDDSGVH